MKKKVIGIDVGVNTTTLAIVDIRGNILARDSFPTSEYPNVNNFIETLSEHILMLAEANGGYQEIRSVGISAPSANFVTGCIENAANMPWKGVIPMALMLRDSIGLAVALGNDCHVTALGESAYGSAHGMDNFIVVSSSGHGGLGSCFFSEGRPHLGAGGFAGELGHVCMEDGGRPCNCGRRGCLEQYVTDDGIVCTARELIATGQPTLMAELKELMPQTIGQCADQGDTLAAEVWRRTGFMLGLALANYASILNPEGIILSGTMFSDNSRWLMEPMISSFNEHVFQNIREKVKFVVSDIEESERDVLGASVLAWKVKEYSLFL